MIRLFSFLACLGMLTFLPAKADQPEITKGLPAGTYALFKTNHGEFIAKLHLDKAPIATTNFIGLAEGTKTYTDPKTKQQSNKPYYDGTIFHRIIANFMIQGGDPTATGQGDPGYGFGVEAHPDLLHDKPGVLAMAHSALPNSNGSQFYVTVSPQPMLDGDYTIFGQVVKGMSVVDEISKVPTSGPDRPINDVRLEHVKIYRIGADGQPAANAAATSATVSRATTETKKIERSTTTTTSAQKKSTVQKSSAKTPKKE